MNHLLFLKNDFSLIGCTCRHIEALYSLVEWPSQRNGVYLHSCSVCKGCFIHSEEGHFLYGGIPHELEILRQAIFLLLGNRRREAVLVMVLLILNALKPPCVHYETIFLHSQPFGVGNGV